MADEFDSTQYRGTSQYWRYTRRVVLTDGAKALAEHYHCYWLLDVIASYVPSIPSDEYFAVASLTKKGQTAFVDITNDRPAQKWYGQQTIEYTDITADSITLYVEKLDDEIWVILLPSEH